MALVRAQVALLYPLDDIGQRGVRGRRHADLLALFDNEAVEELDLGAAALDHVLAHGRPMRAAIGPAHFGEAVVVIFGFRLHVAFPGARNQLGNDVVDRFKLVVRRESKEMAVYALLVARGGPKLQHADIDEKDCPEASLNALGPVSPSTPIPDVCHAFNGGMGRGLYSRASNISDLAAYVENWTDRPLVDKTGIKGLYRFETKGWLPMDPSVGAGSSELADRPTVFQMFAALGLRMEPQKGVVEVYVIDHIEKPSEN